MDVVILPLISPDTSVMTALGLLRDRQRSGLVVEQLSEEYTLLYSGDMLRARAAKISWIGQVPGGRPMLRLRIEHARKYELDLVRPLKTWQSYERMLASNGVNYALSGSSRDTAVVVTLHEGLAEMLMMTGGYECSGTPTHYFPEPRVRVGERCPLYPECSAPGGGVPKIRPAS
jgi:hypothetical protein